MTKLLFLLLLFSCTHDNTSKSIKTFTQSFSDQFYPDDPHYVDVYEKYLRSVEKVYSENNQQPKFRSYLDSLNSNALVISQQEHAMPKLFTEKTGQLLTSATKQPFLRFKNRVMNDLSDKLNTARELRIKDEIGGETFKDLQSNYAKFIDKYQAENYKFPL